MNNIFYDQYGLLTTSAGDSGDALHRCAFARLLNHIHGSDIFGLKLSDEDFIKTFRVAPGLWRRHPDETKWYSNPWTTTRDQYVPLICLLKLTGANELLNEIIVFLKQRLWFFPNRVNGWNDGPKKWYEPCDVMTPELYSILHGREKWAWIADKAMIFNSRIKCGHFPSFELGKGIRWGDNKNCDDTSHISVLLTSWHLNQTLGVRTAFDYYVNEAMWPPVRKEFVPDPKYSSALTNGWDGHRIMARLKYWFRCESSPGANDGWGDNPGFAEACRPVIERFF